MINLEATPICKQNIFFEENPRKQMFMIGELKHRCEYLVSLDWKYYCVQSNVTNDDFFR